MGFRHSCRWAHLALAAFAAFLLVLSVAAQAEIAFYVSTAGDDSTGDGSIAAPWRTVAAARDAIRTSGANGNMQDEIVVYVRGGRYDLTQTLSFTPADSGTNGHYITYQSYPDEKATISGGKRITGWTQVQGKPYWVASVPTASGFADYFRQLYVNGVRAERAHSQWINGVSYYADAGTTQAIDGITFNAADIKDYTNVTDLRLCHASSFKIDEFPITAIINDDANGLKSLRLQQPYCQSRYNRGGGFFEPSDEWMIVQAFEELDEPGEWYLNRTTHQVFYYPNSFEDMMTAQVDAPVVDTLMRFTGTSTTSKVRNIRIQNLILEHGNWLFTRDYYIGGGQAEIIYSGAAPTAGAYVDFEIPGEIYLNNTSDIQFIGNTIRHQGACGIHAYNGAQNTLIQGNYFYDLTGAAVIGGRFSQAAIANMEICNNTLISNNVIRNTGSDFMASTLLDNLGHSAFRVVHNDMADGQNHGFHQRTDVPSPSSGPGGTVVSFNKISMANVGGRYGVGDGGYIYTYGIWPGSTVEGNDINTIYVASGNVSGFYLDNSSYGLNVIGNVMRGVKPGGMGYKFVRSLNNDTTVNTANGNYGDSTANWWQVVTDPNYHQMTSGQPLPPAAQAIVDSARLEPAYASLLNQVYGGVDLARGKTATASSQYNSTMPPSCAVDWDYNTKWHQASGEAYPWWSVDLGQAYVIQRIEISPRTDMDQPESRCNFQVQGSNDSDFAEYSVLAEQNEVAFPYRRTGYSNSWIRFVNNPNGFRYLRVSKTASGGLNFSDFQVFGYSAGFNYTGMLWDSSASGEKSDGGGVWFAPNQWWSDAGNQAWVDGGDATFGNGKGSAGTIIINGTNTRVNSLNFNSATTGNYTISGGSFVLGGSNHLITSGLGLNPVIASIITGTSGLASGGLGSVTLTGSNTFTGGVTVNGGTLNLGNAAALNSANPNSITVNAGVLALNGNNITIPNLSVTSGAAIKNGASTDVTLTMNGGNITGFQDGGTGKLAIVATSSITLNATNTFSGGLWIKNGNVDMQAGSSFGNGTVTLGDTSGAANVTLQGHTSRAWGNAIVIAAGNSGTVTFHNSGGYSPTLSGSITLNRWLTLNNNSGNAASRNITLSGKVSGTGGLYIYASRTSDLNLITLSNTTSDFTGGLILASGKLVLSGSLKSDVTASSSIFAPRGKPGTTGNLTINPSATFQVQINGPTVGTQYDQLTVGGTATLSGGLDIIAAPGLAAGTTFTVLKKTSAGAINGAFSGKPEGSSFATGGYNWIITYVGDDGNDVDLTIPTARQAWRFAQFGTVANTGTAADTFDANGDGESNLMEFATGQNPKASTNAKPALIKNGTSLQFSYTRSDAAIADGVTFTVEWSDSLAAGSWSAEGVSEQILSDSGGIQTVTASVVAGSGRRFLRLKVIAP